MFRLQSQTYSAWVAQLKLINNLGIGLHLSYQLLYVKFVYNC